MAKSFVLKSVPYPSGRLGQVTRMLVDNWLMNEAWQGALNSHRYGLQIGQKQEAGITSNGPDSFEKRIEQLSSFIQQAPAESMAWK